MTSLVADIAFQGAKAALAPKGGTSDISQRASENRGGRKFAIWTFWPNIVVSVVAAVAAAAFFVLGLYFANPELAEGLYIAGVACAFLCATSAVAAFYAKKFGFLRGLEDYTKSIKGAVHYADRVSSEVKKHIKGTHDAVERFKEVTEKGKKELGKEIENIDVLYKELEAAQGRLSKLEKAAREGMDEQTNKLSTEGEKLSSHNANLGGQLQTFEKSVLELKQQNKKLAGAISSLNPNTEEYKKLSEESANQIQEQIKMQIQHTNGLTKTVNEVVKGLNKGITQLGGTTDKLGAALMKIEELLSKSDKLNEKKKMEISNASKKLIEYRSFKNRRDKYNALRTWLNKTSPETFQKWKAEWLGENSDQPEGTTGKFDKALEEIKEVISESNSLDEEDKKLITNIVTKKAQRFQLNEIKRDKYKSLYAFLSGVEKENWVQTKEFKPLQEEEIKLQEERTKRMKERRERRMNQGRSE